MSQFDGDSTLLSVRITAAVGWVARRRSVPREAAEEAVQEALLQLLEGPNRFRPKNFDGWLRRVAERRLIDADRHLRTQLPSAGGAEAAERADVNLDLDAVLALRAGLRRLEPPDEEVVVRRLAGQSWKEVARTQGISEEAARKRFERALSELRTMIDGW
jgi:RNA polymerase sigma factor (sigma-70 family)